MSKCLIAQYESNGAAKLGLEVLEKGGFTLRTVSIVSKADDPSAKYLRDSHDAGDRPDPGVSPPDSRGATLGMLIGGTVAAPIAAGTLIGPFIIAGPLVGMAIGAAVGSLLQMDRWGVAHDVSADYEKRVRSGDVLVIVHDVDDLELNDAQALLKTTNPKSIEKFV